MDQLFEKVAEKCKTVAFLESVMSKAHYASEDRELLVDVLGKILDRMEEDAAWGAKDAEAGRAQEMGQVAGASQAREMGQVAEAGLAQEVVMTLGAGVDRLQEELLSEGKLTEAYMVEVLGSEILLLAYTVFNSWVKEHTDFVVKRYYFLGMGEKAVIGGADGKEKAAEVDLRLAALPEMLERSGLSVACTEGYCMVPKKSVAFYAELSKDRAVVCEGVCLGCGRKDCQNRMEAGERARGNRVLDRPLTYGYARIFGLPKA